jgi:uncharacterized protein
MTLENDTPPSDQAQDIDPRLIEVLVCPLTRRALSYDKSAQELISHTVGLAFPIRNGVPIMLVDQARRFEPSQG